MKSLHSKRFVAMVLSLIMVLSMVPGQVLAATEITTSPGSTKLNVEYFTSTLYNWNEDAANAATAQADNKTGGVLSANPTIAQVQGGGYYLDEALTQEVEVAESTERVQATPAVRDLLNSNKNNWTSPSTKYYYSPDNGANYYLVVAKRSANYSWSGTTYTYTWGYSTTNDTKNVQNIGTQVTTNVSEEINIPVYGSPTTVYHLVCNGEPVEVNKTYPSTSSSVDTTLYYRNTGTVQEGKGFYFTNANNKTSAPSFSSWSGNNQNYFIYSGLAETKLSDSVNKPFSNANVNAANLFDENGNSYTDVYTNVKVPYVYNAETGYYTLDSDAYAVYFPNGTPASGATMNIADKPVSFKQWVKRTESTDYYGTGLLPFNNVSSTTRNATYGVKSGTTGSTGSYQSAGESLSGNTDTTVVYGFGMVTSVNFQMTDDGKYKDQDIQFKFSGDDDVWVYVDGTLVLDIGGTHDAVVGTINFATGNVELTSPNWGKIGDKNAANNTAHSVDDSFTSQTLNQENIYTKLGTTLTGFSAQGQHTLTIYYMDRGRGSTNCIIEFNLPQRDTLTVTKDFTQSKTPDGTVSRLTDDEQERYNNVPFGFTLYEGEGTDKPVANKTYYIYENGVATGRSASTDASGHFTLTNGQTAKFNVVIEERGSSWHVVEDTLSETAYCTPAYVVNGGSLTGGYTSPADVKNGSNTAADEYNIVCYNYMNSNIPNPYVHTSEDTIVLDYGLPIEMKAEDLLANDVHRGDSYELIGLYTAKVDPTENAITPVNNIAGKYGDAVYTAADGGKITYTLNKEFKGIETLYYVAKATGNGNVGTQEVIKSYYATGTITIIPATSVYYEENFGSFITYNTYANQWTVPVEDTAQNELQETGYVGKHLSTYGSDPAYLNDSGDSNGSSMKADTSARACSFEYDFTGCGTTIYGRISKSTAYIRVVVTKDDKTVDQQLIDTRVIVNDESFMHADFYYNIPIYNNSGLDFGTYHVKVTIAKAGTILPAGESGADFYLDGIRVHKPMGDNPTALSAYAVDNENNTVVMNIRSKVVSDDKNELGGDDFLTLTDVNGAIENIDVYNNIGPNEELYLNGEDYAVGFSLVNWDAQFYKLYIGLKNPDGNGAVVKFGNTTVAINNSSDCYYDISSYVVLDNETDEETEEENVKVYSLNMEGVSGLVSLTNIKVVGVDEFDIGYADDIIVDGEEGDESNAFVPSTLYFAPLGFFQNDDLNENVEVEEPEVFVPEYLSATMNYASKTKKGTLTAVTSTDVSYVTINGVKYTGKPVAGKLKFSNTFKKIAAGTVYEVVCFNADGVASEPIYITAK